MHRVFNLKLLVSSSIESLVQEYVMKISRKPNLQRYPILVDHLRKIYSMFDFEACELFHLRNIGFLTIGFFGFLRYSEFTNLKTCNVLFDEKKVTLIIEKSKTDRFRKGQKVVFDRNSFPAKFLDVYFKRFRFHEKMKGNQMFVFMSMERRNNKVCIHYMKRMSYSSVRRNLDILFKIAEIPTNGLMTHSLRIGGATEASRLGIPDFQIDANGRWAPVCSRRLYQRPAECGDKSISAILSKEVVEA